MNVNGQANVWFIDPTPTDSSEFTGNIDNAFSGDAQGGSPARLCDMETVVTAELAHILGMTSDGGSRFQFGGFFNATPRTPERPAPGPATSGNSPGRTART